MMDATRLTYQVPFRVGHHPTAARELAIDKRKARRYALAKSGISELH
jgi:hypothetical protein